MFCLTLNKQYNPRLLSKSNLIWLTVSSYFSKDFLSFVLCGDGNIKKGNHNTYFYCIIYIVSSILPTFVYNIFYQWTV